MASESVTLAKPGGFRVAFENVTRPRRKGGHDITILIPKDDEASLDVLRKIVGQCLNESWPNKAERPPKLVTPVKDGDSGDHTNDGFPKSKKYPAFAGHYYITLGTNFVPGLVDANCQPVADLDKGKKLYAGAWVNVQVHAYAYNNEKVGVSLGLDNVQIVRDGDRLGSGSGGAASAAAAFTPLAGADAFSGKTPAADADDDDLGF